MEAKMEPAVVITHGDGRGQLYTSLKTPSRIGNKNRPQPAGMNLCFMLS